MGRISICGPGWVQVWTGTDRVASVGNHQDTPGEQQIMKNEKIIHVIIVPKRGGGPVSDRRTTEEARVVGWFGF